LAGLFYLLSGSPTSCSSAPADSAKRSSEGVIYKLS
jgi:hypothetical protein